MWKAKSKTKEPENLGKAYEYAVFLLSLQLRTVGEVREKMEGRGYTSAVIENVLEQLHDQKYLDDERYAEVFLNNLKQYKNLGYYGIKKKFMLKKLSAEVIEKTLQDGLSKEEELKIARRMLKKEGVAVKSSADDGSSDVTYNTYDEEKSKQKQKIVVKLKSRGFRGEVIAKLMF
jgi:SOS response regulatory protein OraA/RecX